VDIILIKNSLALNFAFKNPIINPTTAPPKIAAIPAKRITIGPGSFPPSAKDTADAQMQPE